MKKAHYDNYNYPSYWDGRDYEHESEVITLKTYLDKIPKINKILDIGCGFGRLAPYYVFRAKNIVLADPSNDLLEEAKDRLKSFRPILPQKLRHISFMCTSVENLDSTFRKKQFDVILMIRVMHHIVDPEKTIQELGEAIKPGGYLILEFANKIHGKATLKNLLHGNFTFPIDIFPADRKSTKNKGSIAFVNHHPDVIKDLLKKNGFRIKDIRSVSNIRSPFVKRHLSINLLLAIERLIQKPLASIYFGPSIFILARKRI